MKNSLILLLIFITTMLVAQDSTSSFTGTNGERKRNPRMDQLSYVPNEIIVKFKDETAISTASRIKAAGISSVDEVLKKYEIAALERIFPEAKKQARARSVRSPQGKELKVPSLDKIYRMTIPEAETGATLARPASIHTVIEELKKLPEVEYAEPNYIYSIDQLQPVGPELSASDLAGMKVGKQPTSPSAVVPNDPLYEQQSYLREIKADLAWAQTTGDTTQVIAILDTGVDWTHPDLKNKIWRNWDEIPDNGIDDDGNGYIDDIRGWDYIFNDNNPMDDNSHGTHVAGIAAAEANNGIGIAGVNWHAKVMPVKVFPSSGGADAATISQGINYASQNGATVINMSFGGYWFSSTMYFALLDANLKNILLVAAAGNDSYSIYDRLSKLFDVLAIHYPSAFSFVLGVQSDGDYSNYDPDGPVFSAYEQGYNYELKAPGTALSTVPNGNYRVALGTSMATPIVAGSIAMYLSFYPNHTIEELWSNLINSSTEMFDIHESMFNDDKPVRLDVMNFEIMDIDESADKDGKADAGEVIDLILQVRNTGYPAQNVYVKLAQSNDGDPNDLTILNDSIYYGSIGIYRSMSNVDVPFKIKVNDDCYNNRTVSLDVTMYNEANNQSFTQKINFKIFNGEDLSGILVKDTTLTPDKYWVISNSLRISTGVTLTILPGTTVEVLSGVDNRGKISALGTHDNWIHIIGSLGGNIVFKYVNMDLKGGGLNANIIDNCELYNLSGLYSRKIINAKISNGSNFFNIECDTIIRCNLNSLRFVGNKSVMKITESIIENCSLVDHSLFKGLIQHNVINNLLNWYKYNAPGNYYSLGLKTHFINNYSEDSLMISDTYLDNDGYDRWFSYYIKDIDRIKGNSFFNNEEGTYFIKTSGSKDFVTLPEQYWGTTNINKIKNKYQDFNQNAGLPYFLFEPKLEAPSDSCHGHVWKVLVNGKDAQDEFVDPVGTGKHRFDVYFNRPMKKDLIPQVSFGGKFPYTSIPINEEGVWSDDGKIYTVYKTIKLTTGDGINRIRVAGAKQDADWGWEIPVEDSRFSFVIAAASSASTEFMATPGLGKVNLEWNHNDLEDGLGYNMYRMEHINDSTLTQPVIVNSSLITDTLYTDYSVVPNKKYYYYYKILRTNMAETDSSRVVSAIPFTASKGDANGDLSVNVLDITTIVAHLLNNNPQPFIREAADVNSDSQINVLDIVGVVNLVLNVPQNAPGIAMNKQVDLYLQNDTLFANSNVDIAAVQLDINGVEKFSDLEVLKALKPFESGNSYSNGSMRVIFYSMSGKSIEPGQSIPLLKLKAESVINDVIIGEPSGSSVKVNYIKTRIPDLSTNMNQNMVELGQNYPNPVSEKANTIIPVKIYEPVEKMILRITNLMGQETYVSELYNLKEGRYEFNWNTTNETGVYFYCVEFVFNGKRLVCPAMKMIVN